MLYSIGFIFLLWSLSFGFAALFHADLERSLLDATVLTLLSVGLGYLLIIFYEHRRYRTSINWIQIRNYETEHENF